MEKLLFYSAVPFNAEDKVLVANKMNYTYQILNFEFPKEHSHQDYWEFSILLEGSVNHHLNGKKEVYEAGTLFYMTTQDYHNLRYRTRNIRYLNILAREEPLLKLLNGISPDFAEKLLKGKHSFTIPAHIIFNVEEILHRVNMLPAQQHEIHSNMTLSALMLILQFLYTQHLAPIEEHCEWKELLNEAMKSKEFLSYKISDLCTVLNYSKSQLHRLFLKNYGVSPHEFLINYKLRYARNLLSHSDMKIIDIATQVGYKNLSQFNIVFKQKFHIPPGEYRKNNKDNSDAEI